MSRVPRIGTLIVLACAAACARVETIDADRAIVHVNVPNLEDGGVDRDRTVAVRDGRIVAVKPSRAVKLSPSTEIIDGGGAYVIPGLADMHAHLNFEFDLTLDLVHGVTLVRNMSGNERVLRWRNEIDSGERLGPTIVTAGPIVDGDPPVWPGSAVVTTPDEARAAVAAQHAAGYDFVKVYDGLSPEVLGAVIAAAHASGMKVGGHVPTVVPLETAMRQGLDFVEHMTGLSAETYVPGNLLQRARELTHDDARLDAEAEVARQLRDGELVWSDIYDAAERSRLAALAAELGVWNTPTLVVLRPRPISQEEKDRELSRPEMQFVPKVVQRYWGRNSDLQEDDPEYRLKRIRDVFFDELLERVRVLHDAGAPLLIGTDAPNPFVYHGASVHEELALWVRAGLSPLTALRAATVAPARFLGVEAERGRVAPGYRADLVLLAADPLADIRNTKKIRGVMADGRWLPRTELQRWMDDAREKVRELDAK